MYTVANNDVSVKILDAIFGVGWQEIVAAKDAAGGASHSMGVIGTILATENEIVLGIMLLLFVVTLLTGVIGTAHDGEPLGKHYSTIWMPIRAVLAVGLITPIPAAGGLSVVQGLLLWFIYQGIGVANTMHGAILEHEKTHFGNLMAPTFSSNEAPRINELTRNVLMQGVIRNTLQIQERLDIRGFSPQKPRWVAQTDPAAQDTIFSKIAYALGDLERPKYDGAHGYWEFTFMPPLDNGRPMDITSLDLGVLELPCHSGSAYHGFCENRKNAIIQYFDALNTVANKVVRAGMKEQGMALSPGEITLAQRQLATTFQKTALDQAMLENPEAQKRISEFIDGAKSRGWIYLGSYHWTLSKIQEEASQVVDSGINFVGPNLRKISKYLTSQGLTAINMELVAGLVGNDGATYASDQRLLELAEATTVGDSSWNKVVAWFCTPFNKIAYWINEGLMKGDPITNLTGVGHSIITAGATVVTSVIGYEMLANSKAGKVIGATVDAARSILPGGNKDVEKDAAGGGGVGALGTVGSMIITGLLATLFMTAISLAYYLPAVPFITWLMGVVSWLILVIECVVAAPLWMLAISIPKGEGFAGEHGKQGFMIVLKVLFQPMLMVIGFMIAKLLIVAIAAFMGSVLELYWSSTTGGMTALLGLIAFLILTSVLIITLAHKVFGLITWLPDNVFRWIGHNAASLGESGDIEKARHSITAALGVIGQQGRVLTSSPAMRARDEEKKLRAKTDEKTRKPDDTKHLPAELTAANAAPDSGGSGGGGSGGGGVTPGGGSGVATRRGGNPSVQQQALRQTAARLISDAYSRHGPGEQRDRILSNAKAALRNAHGEAEGDKRFKMLNDKHSDAQRRDTHAKGDHLVSQGRLPPKKPNS